MRCSEDMRPQRYGWAPGGYMCRCHGVGCKDKTKEDQLFIGDKRATMCSDCAYALPDPVPVDHIGRHVDVIIADNPGKWEQALLRPHLLGWFVGQTMKRLNGAADPDAVYRKVCDRFGAKP
jgi:hypothetical protein